MSSNMLPGVAMVRYSNNLPALRPSPVPTWERWKKVTLLAAAGALCGTAVAVWEARPVTVKPGPVATVTVVTASPDSDVEVARLKARNRRLEALVDTLRKRPAQSAAAVE